MAKVMEMNFWGLSGKGNKKSIKKRERRKRAREEIHEA